VLILSPMKVIKTGSLRCRACGAELYHDHDEEFLFSDDLCNECSSIVESELELEKDE